VRTIVVSFQMGFSRMDCSFAVIVIARSSTAAAATGLPSFVSG